MRPLLLLAGLLLLEGAYFLFDQTNGIVVKTQVIRDNALAAVFGKARVAQVSDLHITRFGVLERQLIAAVARADPDVLFVTGDLIGGNGGIEACVDVFRRIVPGRTVIAVPGNNDHSYGKSRVATGLLVRRLKETGARVLVNESVEIAVRPAGAAAARRLYVVGVDDNFLWKDDIFKATENVPAGADRMLLAHAPNIFEKIDTAHIRLILSGHTHGGQLAVPFLGALYTNPTFRTRKKMVAGLYADGTKTYVNRGIGTVRVPLRLFARPELTVFRFLPEHAAAAPKTR